MSEAVGDLVRPENVDEDHPEERVLQTVEVSPLGEEQ